MLIIALLSQFADGVFAPPPGKQPSITVVGTAIVDTPPDEATFEMFISGEGRDSDTATKALVAKQAEILSALAALGNPIEVQTEVIQVTEALAGDCRDSYSGKQERLAAGACAVVGYVANVGVSIRLSAPKDAGTAIALAGRLGARSAKLDGFRLRDATAARRRATALAVADARARADAIGAASGSRLGAIISLLDRSDPDQIRRDADAPIKRSQSISYYSGPPPVQVPVSPPPVRTVASVTVTFALIP